ncbi:MAG: hypothetical protein E7353_02705 [Clostridiales bacterium]|nr:hypothetical protein [Clostridiales bacterium]
MKRLIAFIVCLLMVFSLTPFSVFAVTTDDITTEYVPDVTEETVVLDGEISSTTITGASISVSGAPANSTLSLTKIDERNYDEGVISQQTNSMGDILGAYDISVEYNGHDWQPENGQTVTVKTLAGDLGLFSGDQVYVIHIHEDENGQKEYKTIGPLTVENGEVVFETDSFSEYYYLKGDLSFTINQNSDGDIYYLEPGTVLSLNFSGTGTFSSQASSITYSNKVLVIGALAESGDTATVTVKTSGWWNSWTSVVTFVVKTRQEIVRNIVDNGKIMIAILDQSSGNFPSEPTNTSGQYYHVNDLDGNGTYSLQEATCNFNNNADQYLNADAMSSSSAWMYDVQGTQIYGVVDASGRSTLAAFENALGEQTVNWTQIAGLIAEWNDSHNGTNNDIRLMYKQEISQPNTGPIIETHSVYLTTDETKTIQYYKDQGESYIDNKAVYYAEFRLIPYVIKYMTDGVWHVDVALVRGDAFVLGYNLNMADYTLDGNYRLVLPDSHVYMECPDDDDRVIYVDIDDWAYKNTVFNVYHKVTNEKGTIQFKGWAKTPTATADQLIQPKSQIVLSEANTILYAIWDVSESLKTDVNSITIHKDVLLVSDHDSHPLLPVYGTIDFVPFHFTLDLAYSNTFKNVEIEANKYVADGNGGATIQTLKLNLADIVSGAQTCDYITVYNDRIELMLYDGESIRFNKVPVFGDDIDGEDVYTVTENITDEDHQHHYSVVDGEKVFTKSIPAVMSTSHATVCQFFNYYRPPLAGIELHANNGHENEAYIFKITAVSSQIFDVDHFAPIMCVVPVNGVVVIKNLPVGTYRVTPIKSWDTLYSTPDIYIDVAIEDGKTHVVTFNYDYVDGKYLYGYSYVSEVDHHIVQS